jgi:hypothetical protein
MLNMLNSIYDKTEKGREEIATRKHHLANRLRTLLVMVDGKQSATDLLKKVSALGFDENNVQELLDQEFITVVSKAGKRPSLLRLKLISSATYLRPSLLRLKR